MIPLFYFYDLEHLKKIGKVNCKKKGPTMLAPIYQRTKQLFAH